LFRTNSSKEFIEKYLIKVQTLAELLDIKPIYRPDSGNVLGQAEDMFGKINQPISNRTDALNIYHTNAIDMKDRAWLHGK